MSITIAPDKLRAFASLYPQGYSAETYEQFEEDCLIKERFDEFVRLFDVL